MRVKLAWSRAINLVALARNSRTTSASATRILQRAVVAREGALASQILGVV